MLLKYTLVKYLMPLQISILSSILENENLYLILLLSREPIHLFHYPSFFGVINVGTTHMLMIGTIKPFDNNSPTYFFNLTFSHGLILSSYWFSKLILGIDSNFCAIFPFNWNPSRKSLCSITILTQYLLHFFKYILILGMLFCLIV